MVIRKNLNQKFALISVSDKTGLKNICKNLKKYNYRFISTGNTHKKIISLGYNCLELSKVSKFKEILDGRVKTLNPKVFGSILYKRTNKDHSRQFKKLNFPKIDIVIVNLYPFKKTASNKNYDKSIEMIDIGGPSLIRAASKNFKDITIVSKVSNYSKFIKNLNKNNGSTDINFRKKMATEAFEMTSKYDDIIFKFFSKDIKKIDRKINLRYGENPFQESFIVNKNNKSIFDYQLSGKRISYNNIIDIDSGFNCLNEFSEPTCVIIKHTNPCGVSSSKTILKAYKNALECDKISAFGGIVLFNRKVNFELARSISKSFFEVIVAKDFDKLALNLLSKKENLILLKINKLKKIQSENRSTIFGDLYQKKNNELINKNYFKIVSSKKTSKKNIDDLIFATKVVKHLKSNAIALVKNKQTIGLGLGQTNRVDAVKSAIKKMNINFGKKNFVCASDGFFPFIDSIKLLNKNYCNVIAQPSGSKNDYKVIKFAKDNKLTLFFLKERLFKH